MGFNNELGAWSKASQVFPDLAPDVAPSTLRILEGYHHIAHQGVAKRDALMSTTLCFANIHYHGDLLVNFLKARYETFIEEKGWTLPSEDGMEFDQYDTPACRWVAVHEDGEILAGIRLLPTTARCGVYSYMVRDAQMGVIDSIPRDILFVDAPVNDYTWEATRLFISHRVPAERRSAVQILLLSHMARTVFEMGGTQIIGIVPSVFYRWMQRLRMTAAPLGPVLEIAGDRTQAAMMPVRTAL